MHYFLNFWVLFFTATCTEKVKANAGCLNLLGLGQHWTLKMLPGVFFTLLMLLFVFFSSLTTSFLYPTVQYNESEPSTIADWKQLIDVSTQDGTEDSHVLVGPNTVHLMVDHFTLFAVIGESSANQKAERDLQVLAYVTPPEANSDCVVRVYCVEGTPAAIEVCEVTREVSLF